MGWWAGSLPTGIPSTKLLSGDWHNDTAHVCPKALLEYSLGSNQKSLRQTLNDVEAGEFRIWHMMVDWFYQIHCGLFKVWQRCWLVTVQLAALCVAGGANCSEFCSMQPLDSDNDVVDKAHREHEPLETRMLSRSFCRLIITWSLDKMLRFVLYSIPWGLVAMISMDFLPKIVGCWL